MMHDEAVDLPINVFVQMPSCVPSAPGLENAGAELGVDDSKYHLPSEAGFHDGGTKSAKAMIIGKIDVASFFDASQLVFGKKVSGK